MKDKIKTLLYCLVVFGLMPLATLYCLYLFVVFTAFGYTAFGITALIMIIVMWTGVMALSEKVLP